jgi:hypothetical protein
MKKNKNKPTNQHWKELNRIDDSMKKKYADLNVVRRIAKQNFNVEKRWYCPFCKREVMRKLTAGQIVGLFILYIFVIPGILYSFMHTRKCPNCYSRMYKLPWWKIQKVIKEKENICL